MVCNEPVKVYMYGQDAVKLGHICVKPDHILHCIHYREYRFSMVYILDKKPRLFG
jgi:hypothetical protein